MEAITLSAVESVEVDQRRITLNCTATVVNEGGHPPINRTIPLVIEFYAPHIFRVTVAVNPDSGTSSSLLDLDEAAIQRPLSLSTTRTEGSFVISTAALTLNIDLETVDMTAHDGERVIVSTQSAYTNTRNEPVARPLGFTEAVTDNYPLSVEATHMALRLHPDENVYGGGERFTDLNKRGQSFSAWVTQANGTVTDDAYKSVPFYLSDRGYGLLVDTTRRVEFDFGATAPTTTEVLIDGDELSFLVFADSSFKQILQDYTALTGRAPRLPKWTFGLWMSRNSYQSAEEVTTVAETIREHNIPCDVLHFDPAWMDPDSSIDIDWGTTAVPDPEPFISKLDQMGFHLSLWEYPYVVVGTEPFEAAKANGYLVGDGSGKPLVIRRPSLPDTRAGIIDFTDEQAVEWWRTKHRPLIESGVDAFKLDFGEYLPETATTANSLTGRTAHNDYPTRYQQAVAGAFAAEGKPPVLWARSGWAGSQRYPIHWSGDTASTFDGFAASVRGGLSLCLSGFQFWSCDLGGYKPTPSRDLYVRWAQWGLLGLSHPRFHGKTPREPWHYDTEVLEIVREFVRERYRLIPYIYSYAEEAARTGLPVMRPMVLEYPADSTAKHAQTQHLVGEELLLVPVLDPDGQVRIDIPRGEWVDYWSGDRVKGPTSLHQTVPLDDLPVYIKAGSILPIQKPTQHLTAGTPDTVTLRVVPKRNALTEADFPFYDEDTDRVVDVTMSVSSDRSTVEVGIDPAERTHIFEVRIEDVHTRPESVTCNGDVVDDEACAFDPQTCEFTISL